MIGQLFNGQLHLFPIASLTHYHKFGGLKQHVFIIL